MKIEEKGYKFYPQRAWNTHNLYQKRVDNERVCETNDKLYINIREYQIADEPKRYEIGITAEYDGIWWDLKAYGVSEEQLESRLEEFEQKLIKMFNAL